MITGILPFQVGDGRFKCEMRYDESDPFALTFIFRQGDHETTWEVSRDLVREGLDSEPGVGFGDIQIRRDSHNTIQIFLRPGADIQGTTVTAPRRSLKDFLRRAFALVPAGRESEHFDWDELDKERALW